MGCAAQFGPKFRDGAGSGRVLACGICAGEDGSLNWIERLDGADRGLRPRDRATSLGDHVPATDLDLDRHCDVFLRGAFLIGDREDLLLRDDFAEYNYGSERYGAAHYDFFCHGKLMFKQCSRCRESKPLEAFYKDAFPRNKSGRQSRCIACAKRDAVAYALANPERVRAARKAWGKRNPEKQRASSKAKRLAKPDLYKAIDAAKARRYRERHPDRVQADVTANNATRIARWRKRHPGREAEFHGVRRTIMKRRLPWANREKMQCLYQLARIYRTVGIPCEVDHIVPLQHPMVCGLHVAANLNLVPPSTNRRKSNSWQPES